MKINSNCALATGPAQAPALQVDVVEFRGGNVGSVQRCLTRLGIGFRTVNAASPPVGSRPILVPGVGAFGEVMNVLREDGLADRIVQLVNGGTPFIGICVGMQILFDGSEESPGAQGLGLLKGEVVRFNMPKVPLIGWTEINGRGDSGFVYFVNSYFARPSDQSCVLYSAEYGGEFCAAVKSGNVTGFQFHPEKSGPFGAELLKRSIEDACRN